MTLLEIVNKVLRRLREDTVTATTDNAYATLIAEFVSDIHQECVEAHDWGVSYKLIEWDTVQSQREYDLSATVATTGDVISGGAVTTLLSEPVVTQGGLNAWLFADSSADQPISQLGLLRKTANTQWNEEDRNYEEQPEALSMVADGTLGGVKVSVYPVPKAAYRIRAEFLVPERTLEVDGTDDAVDIEVPWRPIYLGALYMALNERGEEMGEPGNVAERRYVGALGAAIEADSKTRGLTNRYEFYRD